MDSGMWQTTSKADFLYSSHERLSSILSCGKHDTVFQIGFVPCHWNVVPTSICPWTSGTIFLIKSCFADSQIQVLLCRQSDTSRILHPFTVIAYSFQSRSTSPLTKQHNHVRHTLPYVEVLLLSSLTHEYDVDIRRDVYVNVVLSSAATNFSKSLVSWRGFCFNDEFWCSCSNTEKVPDFFFLSNTPPLRASLRLHPRRIFKWLRNVNISKVLYSSVVLLATRPYLNWTHDDDSTTCDSIHVEFSCDCSSREIVHVVLSGRVRQCRAVKRHGFFSKIYE